MTFWSCRSGQPLTGVSCQYIDMCMSPERAWTERELRAALDEYESELRTAGKARNTINTYVQHPERFINWLVGRYVTRARPSVEIGDRTGRDPAFLNQVRDQSSDPTRSRSSYEPLRAYLASRTEPVVHMTFAQVESVLGRALPASARKHRPWWANERAGTHVHARAWLDAGRKAMRVDINAGTVDFVR
jgi:hypothetical protein